MVTTMELIRSTVVKAVSFSEIAGFAKRLGHFVREKPKNYWSRHTGRSFSAHKFVVRIGITGMEVASRQKLGIFR